MLGRSCSRTNDRLAAPPHMRATRCPQLVVALVPTPSRSPLPLPCACAPARARARAVPRVTRRLARREGKPCRSCAVSVSQRRNSLRSGRVDWSLEANGRFVFGHSEKPPGASRRCARRADERTRVFSFTEYTGVRTDAPHSLLRVPVKEAHPSLAQAQTIICSLSNRQHQQLA